MTNWKTYKIEGIHTHYTAKNKILFNLGSKDEAHVEYKVENGDPSFVWVSCTDTYPFNTWEEGDYIEIDNDKTRYESPYEVFDDTSIVRKVSSSTNIVTTRGSSSDIVISPSAVEYMKSQEARELAREMSRMVDDNPGKEVEYKIQVENKDGRKISHSLIMRKQN